MKKALIEKDEIEIIGEIEKISWYFPMYPPAVCIIKLRNVRGDFPFTRAVVFMSPNCQNLMEVLQQIAGDETRPILSYEPLPEESIVVRVKSRINDEFCVDDNRARLTGYDIELVA